MNTLLKWLRTNPLYAVGTAIAGRGGLPPDFDEGFASIFQTCKPFTMTSVERMYALYEAVRYIVKAQIAGDLVECGVWRGGSSMVMARALKEADETQRTLFLYDTFAGMSEPAAIDKDLLGTDAHGQWKRSLKRGGASSWCYGDLEDVRRNLFGTGYPSERMRFVKGKVEDTIPATLPERIALLRLDTDWFDSTYHEFVHLYPRLERGGVLIVDDYGHWKGAREATDRYLTENQIRLLLNRVDYTGRVAIKP